MELRRISLHDLRQARQQDKPFACLTAYDATMARLIEQAGAKVILVGDSLGMVMQGHETTVAVSVEDICYHCACVQRTTQRALIMADMPFLSDITLEEGLRHAKKLIQSGAQVVKLEAGMRHCELIEGLSEYGIAVCAHLGLLPQSIHKLGSYACPVMDAQDAEQLKQEAQALVDAGADLLLLECVPEAVAEQIVQACKVPVIGIGAGPHCHAQVLVTQDILGMSEHLPAFARNFLSELDAKQQPVSILRALQAYVAAVEARHFPGTDQTR